MGEIEELDFSGSGEFVVSLQRTLDADASHQEISAIERRSPPRPLTQIAEAHGRDEAIFDAYAAMVHFEGDWESFGIALPPGESHCIAATMTRNNT